jgi:hypothetical protein
MCGIAGCLRFDGLEVTAAEIEAMLGLPPEIVDRAKVGFTVPLDAWFHGGLRDLAWELLASRNSFVNEFMSSAGVRDLLVSHDCGRRNEHMRLWTLLGSRCGTTSFSSNEDIVHRFHRNPYSYGEARHETDRRRFHVSGRDDVR